MNPFGNAQDQQAFAGVLFGFRSDRATAVLPQSVAGALFTVAGGRVLLLGVIGEVTVAIQNQANNTKLKSVPTVGSTVDICAVVDVANLEVGGKLSVAGVFATALQKTLAGASVFPTNAIVLAPGSLSLDCAASNTGSVKWTAFWVPLDDGATLVAA